ncbi:hypothetical protein BDV27DRAFT_123367 [Aspergillus caelatus]|uniref:Uncharacterized protein n=1 Tax=Aspergillus caelatus TaxID=61420 RepID=A0A5N7ADL8_9EURO|nr:uncharacterized protein BDV27DRAFT_123367 [Aspergillus caelatus]KAE8367753.1 hypothetical protein BDV27DRAFT_123367 [Aspergillus caelatus]
MLPSHARAMTLTEYAIPLLAFQSSLLSTNVYQSSGVGNDSYSSKDDSYGVRHKARPNIDTPLTVA